MSIPTCRWGNYSDVYKTIPGPSTTVPGSTDGPQLGEATFLADMSMIQFLQWTATTAASAVCQTDLANSNWTGAYQVTPTTAVNQLVVACNDQSLLSLTANYCAWGKRYGAGSALVAADVAVGKIVASSDTAGVLYAATAGTDLQGQIVNTVAVGGAQAISPILMT